MPHVLYVFTVFAHIVAATLWVGGMLFMSLMLVPALRAQGDPKLTARLIRAVGKRYHRWGWGALGVLLATGLLQLHLRGIPHSAFVSTGFWRSAFGTTLAWKLALVTLVALLSLAHDLMAARGSGTTDPETLVRNRRVASWMGRVTLVLSLIIVLLGVMLVRGNPFLS